MLKAEAVSTKMCARWSGQAFCSVQGSRDFCCVSFAFSFVAVATLCFGLAEGFTGTPSADRFVGSSALAFVPNVKTLQRRHFPLPIHNAFPVPSPNIVCHNPCSLHMTRSDDSNGPGIATTIALVGILLVFLGSSAAPFLDALNTDATDSVSSELANTVVTRQDPDALKQQQYASKYDRLSRTRIQEKLSGLPAFYLVKDKTGEMDGDIYMSYADATKAAETFGSSVKATTLDQVMYPLVLKRGRMKMAPPPTEVRKAEEAIENDVSAQSKTYKLIPSSAAMEDAASIKMEVTDGDVPLFLADRLAFASSSGPQVPLFLEKNDAITSYSRLRVAGGSKLPEEPSIRSTTLLEEINSMERGTRPGVSQLAFYAPERDLLQADELIK